MYLAPSLFRRSCVFVLFLSSLTITSAHIKRGSTTAACAARTTPTPTKPTTTPPPKTTQSKLSCELHFQDPDQGIDQAYCVCDGSKTLSPLSVPPTGQQSDSCAYTAIPSTAAETVTTLKETYSSNCKVCTQIQMNQPTCTMQKGCTPTSAVASVTAGSSPVHVGTLTGTVLYTSISSALEQLCPPVTQTKSPTVCATGSVTIGDIVYVSEDNLQNDGELVVKVEASSYNLTSLRDAMIKSAALTAQKASLSSSNCYNQTYEVMQAKRDLPLLSFGSKLRGRDHPYLTESQQVLCNSVSFAAVNYYSQYWRVEPQPGASDFIFANWNFQVAPGGDFLCNFLDGLIEGLAVIQPEFTVEGTELGDAINAICGDVENP
jgi:hypothetical protein